MQRYAKVCIVYLFIASGCATLMTSTTQDIGVSSVPIGATVTVDGSTHTTPTVIKLSKKKSHIIVIQKNGYVVGSATLTTIRDGGTFWLNLLLIHPIFIGVGMGIDLATGAYKSLIPENIHISLEKKKES